MPNCFTLTRKTKPEEGPVKLSVIDEEMCKHFGVKVEESIYHAWWYDIIGFRLAMGKSFEEIKAHFREQILQGKYVADYEHLIEIADWLDENFTTDSWAEIGKR